MMDTLCQARASQDTGVIHCSNITPTIVASIKHDKFIILTERK